MTIIGIDLGTTNSLGAYWKDGKPHLIKNALGEFLTPSVVGVDDDGTILVGKPAQVRLQTHPHLTCSSFKRQMGSKSTITLNKSSFSPEELSSLVIRSIKADAETELGETITEAVISVPAYFSDAQRTATKLAGELAGVTVQKLINEPTAAAITYGLHDREDDSKFMVVDLGGGTFDVSILELFDGVMEVHASSGNNFLGGEDFTEVLANWFLQENQLDKNSLDPVGLAKIFSRCEAVKLALQSSGSIQLDIEGIGSLHVSKDAYEKKCEPLIKAIQGPIERALRDSNIHPNALSDIVLVGGATRSPLIKSLIARLFQRLPICTINPDEVVALGTAIQAALKQKDAALSEVVLTDVSPYTLGVDMAKEHEGGRITTGHFSPIIQRNTCIPASRVERFQTMQNGQKVLEFNIFQGESRMAHNNIKLGSIEINVPKGKAGEQSADIRFTYDVNGLLEVQVTRSCDGETVNTVIENSESRLTKKEIENSLKRMGNLKIHPRDNLENRTTLARAEKLYQERIDLRDYLSEIISQFEHHIEQQDPRTIERQRSQVIDIITEIEKESLF